MTLQLFKKPLGQFRRFQEQAALARPFREILGLKENGSVDDHLVDQAGLTTRAKLEVEGELAHRQAFSLISYTLGRDAAVRHSNTAQPVSEGSTEFDLPAACSQRLCLQIQEDEASVAAERDPHEDSLPGCPAKTFSRLNKEAHILGADAPMCFRCQLPMG